MTSQAGSADAYRRNRDGVLSTDLMDQSVLLLVATGQFFELDTTGSFIWSLLEKEQGMNDIVGALMQEFNIDEPTCRLQTEAFLKDMTAKRLVEIQ